MIQLRQSRGFALLEVFLSIVLIGVISYASYSLVGFYQTKNLVQNFQADAVNISQGLSSVINDASNTESSVFIKDYKLWTIFTNELHIPQSDLNCSGFDANTHKCLDDYVYLRSGLMVPDSGNTLKHSIVNFSLIPMASNSSANYLVLGVTMTDRQLAILIQNPSYGMGIFYADLGKGIKESKAASQLPHCDQSSCTYSVYLSFPYNDAVSDFNLSGDFVTQAPV
jgi:type II secretory pathway pseudopilin PulG